MTSRNLPFLSNSPEVSGTITRFVMIERKLDRTLKVATLKVELDWVLSERVTGSALTTPWKVTFFTRDKARHVEVAAFEVSTADSVKERGAEGRELRFHVDAELDLPLDGPPPPLEVTIRRVEDVFRSPAGDMMGYADAPEFGPSLRPRMFRPSMPELPPQFPPMAPAPAPAAAPIAATRSEPPERVDSAVFCPQTVGRTTSFLVQTFVYPPAQEDLAREHAHEADAMAARRGVFSLPADVPVGTRIDLHLEMPTLLVEEPDAALIWRGTLASAQFDVAVPADAPLGTSIGRIRFSIAGVPAGTLRFQVTIAAAVTNEAARAAEVGVRRYRRAFVSYASKDRGEVMRRVQAFRIAGLSVFQDVLDLEPGERWERELYREIDNCDVLLLFWSSAAAASPWVAKEIDYALARKQGQDDRPPDIAPVPIEGPPIPPPPEKLRHLHFNDALLAHIAANG
jgi:hypothetical protein